MIEDLYQVLGIDKTATPIEIRAAYKKLASKYHPDKNPTDPTAKDKFQRIQQAFSILAVPETRAQYDADTLNNAPFEVEKAASSMIRQLFSELISSNDYACLDYPGLIVDRLNLARYACRTDLTTIQGKKEKVEYLIEHTTGDNIVIQEELNAILSELNAKIAYAEEAITVMELGIKILETYQYTGEKVETSTWPGYFNPHFAGLYNGG